MKRKITWRVIFQGIVYVTIGFLCIGLHVIHWYLYTITFMPLILPLSIILLSGWFSAKWFRKRLTRLFDGIDEFFLHIGFTLLCLSWIPFALLMDTNYLLAEKEVSTKKIPVAAWGYDTNRNRDAHPWVKIKWDWCRKKLSLSGNGMLPEDVDRVEIQYRKGFLGFDIIDNVRILRHSYNKFPGAFLLYRQGD